MNGIGTDLEYVDAVGGLGNKAVAWKIPSEHRKPSGKGGYDSLLLAKM